MSITKLNNLVNNIELILNSENNSQKKTDLIENFKNDNAEIFKKYSGIFTILERDDLKDNIERFKIYAKYG